MSASFENGRGSYLDGSHLGAIVGHLYMQTNAIENAILHYGRRHDGTLVVVEEVATGGAGSGVFKPVSGQLSAPNAFEGAGSVVLTSDRRYLFTTNGGDNSVSSFSVSDDGSLKLIAKEPTGEPVIGRSGTVKSLAYAARSRTLFALHAFGPGHIRAFTVDDGGLMLRPDSHTVNSGTKTDRIPTQLTLSPDGRFLLVDILFDARPGTNADGSPILMVANEKDPDGMVVFPLGADGSLGPPKVQDAGGTGPFFTVFVNGSSDTFLNGMAASDGVTVSRLDQDGNITNSGVVAINSEAGKPSELCWLALKSDNTAVFATNFGLSNISSFKLDKGQLSILKDPACASVPGDGTFRSLNNLVSSGPSDSWIAPTDDYMYQIYGNASVLLSYRVHEDGSLTEVGRNSIPYNSPQGLTGF